MAAWAPVVAGDEENGELAVDPSVAEPIRAVQVLVKFAVANPLINPDNDGTISRYLGLEIPLVDIWDTEPVDDTPFIWKERISLYKIFFVGTADKYNSS